MKTHITAAELNDALKAGAAPAVIDTLPPEYYGQGHIPGAINACVYEMVFLQRVAEFAGGHDAPLVVYGSSDRSRGAAVAVEKLKRAGYADVVELAGGLEAWQAARYPIEPAEASPQEEPGCSDGRYLIDPAASRLEWNGRNLNGRHMGTIALAGGEVTLENGTITGGKIIIDMDKIVNLDLRDEEYNRMLITHLKSDDFFDVTRYPHASYTISRAEPLVGAVPGAANYLVKGSLEVKGVGRELQFPAEIVPQANGQLKARASSDLDRTEWGVIYGSGRYFEKLGMHLVSDIVTVEIFLVANRCGE
jgi:polyisoprenoid-binding protein YceI